MRVLFSALLLAGYQLVFSQIPSPPPGFVGVAYEGFDYTYRATLDGESGDMDLAGDGKTLQEM